MFTKTRWLVREAQLRFKYMTVKDCIFCKIVSGKIKCEPVLETDEVLAINDVNPIADIHILIIPKRHIESVLTVKSVDGEMLIKLFEVAQRLVKEKNLSAFRLAFNGGKYQHVPHLHMHLVAGRNVDLTKL